MVVASLDRDEPIPLPSWWLEDWHRPPSELDRLVGNPGSTLPVLSAAGLEQLARVSDWTAHQRTWGASLVRGWLGSWQENNWMAAYNAEFPASSVGGYQHAPRPPVRYPEDQAAEALCLARGDHAAAQLATAGLECPRVALNLQLAPLAYGEGLMVWCELMQAGQLGW